jgi:hypothetical protein
MKAFKKLALVTAIAAAPFAQAEMTSIDDSVLSEMTGQAGISIELSAQATIGSIVYTDTDGVTGLAADAGTIGLNTIAFGGAAVAGQAGSNFLEDIKIDIDVDANDGLIIHLGATNPIDAISGANPVDFGLTVGSVDLNSSLVLASDISIAGNIGPIDVAISNAGVIDVDAYFEVTAGSLNVDVLGVGITNLTIGQDSNPISTDATYGAQVAGVAAGAVAANAALITGTGDAAANDYAVSLGYADEAALRTAGDPTEIATLDANRAAGEAGATAQVEAAATQGVSNMAYVGMTISTADTFFVDGAGTVNNVTNALSISVDSMSMDIAMDVSVGSDGVAGLGIGNVAINDLDLSGTTLKIYGR